MVGTGSDPPKGERRELGKIRRGKTLQASRKGALFSGGELHRVNALKHEEELGHGKAGPLELGLCELDGISVDLESFALELAALGLEESELCLVQFLLKDGNRFGIGLIQKGMRNDFSTSGKNVSRCERLIILEGGELNRNHVRAFPKMPERPSQRQVRRVAVPCPNAKP